MMEHTMSNPVVALQPNREVSPEIAEKPALAAETSFEVTVSRPAAARASIKNALRRILLAGAAVAVLAGGSWYGWNYVTVGRFQVSTDDAYVKADNTTIAPKVSGYLAQVLVGDNERVAAGQVLAHIDDRDFRVALDQAR